MKNLKLALATSLLASVALAMPVTASPASAQSVSERTEGNGNRAKLGLQRSQNYNNGIDTVAPVAAPGKTFNGNRAKLGAARGGVVYEGDITSDADDRTMGYGNRAKLGLHR